MASAWLARQFTSGNQKTFTISCWVKRGSLGTRPIVSYAATVGSGGSGARGNLSFDNDLLYFQFNPTGSSWWSYYVNTRLFRDTHGWYHIVIRVDTTDGSASNRLKIYVNGEQQTLNSSIGTQDLDTGWNANNLYHHIGRYASSTSVTSTNTWDGGMAHFHYVDGTAYDASTFGETDATTGIWKPKTSPSVTYGTNGFFLKFDNSANMGLDSGGSNNLTTNGTIIQDKDTPSNVFATINPLNSYFAGGSFSIGNTKIEPSSSAHGAWNTGTLGFSSGKYYWEVKVSGSNNGDECQVGIADKSPNGNSGSSTAGTSFGYNSNGEYGIYAWNGAFIGNAVANPYTSYGSSCSNGIIMIAVDLDNSKFYGGCNGTWFGSGDPANGTNGKTIQAVADTVDGFYYPAISTYQGYTGTAEFNFGNGYFGTTAVSSAQNPDDGIGIFEYDVPAGYRALCTKSINAEEYS